MNILFLLIGSFKDINQHEIYPDLVRKFRDEGHCVYVVCCNERREGKKTELVEQNAVKILRVKIGNITKCNFVEKGISILMIERQYKNAIKKFFSGTKFNAVVYATPPITLVNVIKYIKERDFATAYLMLKDIFPQNAVDIGVLSTKGIIGLMYRFFRFKEIELYNISDFIGCMSKANCDYLIKNDGVESDKVGICPNCFEIKKSAISEQEKAKIREKYDIPRDCIVLIYGGNLGKPQGIPFLIECLRTQKNNVKVFFVIVGGGTEYSVIEDAIYSECLNNASSMK